ncbi:MAG: molecular chaperone HtpG, partial [Lachnospiraceae bacterium]|nr:molecular chaperone HtpG [Lachnospiraceae bacterium]
MEYKSGNVSINTENIFPIIKKWLYSEKDIYIREVVSNSSDAISKLKKLISVGEADIDESNWKIEVVLNKDAGTITIKDNGIGMTEEEVVKYINQIAFSGAKDFMEKYEGKADDSQIIGHFGLGFYSVFMVSDNVQIDTLSWVPGSEAVHWESDTGMDFAISPSDKADRGTEITLHIAEDSVEFLDAFKLKETLMKYFAFLPVELFFIEIKEEDDKETEDSDDTTDDTKAEAEAKEPELPKPINNTTPLWMKPVKDCTEEEYKSFYHEVFHDFNDPLFWIHLNIDYPFNLKGILYFPKLKDRYDIMEGTIKVYYNQVFVADNIKEIIPEFLMLLRGVIDCPDLPLNVSRSFLQNDGYVNKISGHITKKVADKLTGMFNTEREEYNKCWEDINPFVKYECLKDDKFYDKVKDAVLFKTTDGEFITVNDITKDKTEIENIYYIDDEVAQTQYVNMLKESGIKIVIMTGPIDSHFINYMEYKNSGKIKFVRVDSDITDAMKDTENKLSDEEREKIVSLLSPDFAKASGNDKIKVSVEAVKSPLPAILLVSEQSRRMAEMMKMYGGNMNFGGDEVTITLNSSNQAVKTLIKLADNKEENSEKIDFLTAHIYDMAL